MIELTEHKNKKQQIIILKQKLCKKHNILTHKNVGTAHG